MWRIENGDNVSDHEVGGAVMVRVSALLRKDFDPCWAKSAHFTVHPL